MQTSFIHSTPQKLLIDILCLGRLLNVVQELHQISNRNQAPDGCVALLRDALPRCLIPLENKDQKLPPICGMRLDVVSQMKKSTVLFLWFL